MNLNRPHRIFSTIGIILLIFTTFQIRAQREKSIFTPDTVFILQFQVNMSKAVQDGIFRPDSGVVDVVLDHEVPVLRLVPGAGYKYSGSIIAGLDSGVTYHYKYRINDSVWETVTRTATAVEGITSLNDWWNNEVMNSTLFRVNMKYQVESGRFHPESDHMVILGSMNDWQGSTAMQRTDTVNFLYSISYSLDPGSIQEYKFRINSDSSGLELLNKPNRMLRIAEGATEVTNDFDNVNPAKLPMTFNCNMKYFIQAGHFDLASDFLDVAGSFNNWEGQDILFDLLNDSMYTVTLFLDTAFIHGNPLEFKFRINGNWNSAELWGKPNRIYTFHDTTGNNPNVFSCWYDDKNPGILMPPWVYNVGIQGNIIQKQVLTGFYSYENVNGIPEGISLYKWYQSNDSLGTTLIPIDSAWHINYTIDTTDIGKWLVFEVTPVAASGDSAMGNPVRVITPCKAGTVGIEDLGNIISRGYPNPTHRYLEIEALSPLEKIEFYGYNGIRILCLQGINQKRVRIDLSDLPAGLYILKALSRNQESGMMKVVKL